LNPFAKIGTKLSGEEDGITLFDDNLLTDED
jgi:hypothetical protein